MYLKVFKEDVIEGLQKAANIIPQRTGAAYLRSIWLRAEKNTLELLSTDSNIEFRGSYTAEVIEGGLVGVQGRDDADGRSGKRDGDDDGRADLKSRDSSHVPPYASGPFRA